jgi:acetyl esterase
VPVTAQARRLLDRFEELGVKPYDEMGVLEARAVVAPSLALQGDPQEMDRVSEVLAAGVAGEVPVRVYRPLPDEPLPLVVYFHGGGVAHMVDDTWSTMLTGGFEEAIG